MVQSTRDRILNTLRAAPAGKVPPRPALPPMAELSLGREELVERLITGLAALSAESFRVKSYPEVLSKLEEIARGDGWKSAVASTDEVVAPLDLPGWGRGQEIQISVPSDFQSRDAYKDWVFERAQAGITGVDFAVAESGTLVLFHDRDQARLISLAPIHHVAVVPVERVIGVYEQMLAKAEGEGKLPSQICFITGPSLTSDIQATPFRGMHGPRRLTVILVG